MKVLLDANILIALYKKDDSTHKRALDETSSLHKKGAIFVALNLVVQEAVTVISHKMGMEHARKFYAGCPSVLEQSLPLNEALEKQAWEIFLKQTKKGSSFVDCANLACMDYYRLDGILSFDNFYPQKFRLTH